MSKQWLLSYAVSGKASHSQTWSIAGKLELPPGDFHRSFDMIMRRVFEALTNGTAVYGNPGVGCSGPYEVTQFSIKRID